MDRFTKVIFGAVLVLCTSTAIADSGNLAVMPPRPRDGAPAVGESTWQSYPGTFDGNPSGGTSNCPGRAFPDGGSSAQDMPDPLLGAPADYEDLYAITMSSELENRTDGPDSGMIPLSASRPTSPTNLRKSTAAGTTLKRNPAATQSSNMSTSGWKVDLYRSPW